MTFPTTHTKEQADEVFQGLEWHDVLVEVRKEDELMVNQQTLDVVFKRDETSMNVHIWRREDDDIHPDDISCHDLNVDVTLLLGVKGHVFEWKCELTSSDHNNRAYDRLADGSSVMPMHCDGLCIATSVYEHIPRLWRGVNVCIPSVGLAQALSVLRK